MIPVTKEAISMSVENRLKNPYNFATAVTDNSATNWKGVNATQFLTPAITESTVRKIVNSFDGVAKNAILVPVFSVANIVFPASAATAFPIASTGTGLLSQRAVTLVPLMIAYDFNESIVDNDFLQIMKAKGSQGQSVPEAFQSFVIDSVLIPNIHHYSANNFWNGGTGASNYGLFTQFITDGLTSVGTTAGLTAGNILAEMQNLVLQIPAAVRSQPDLMIFMNITDFSLFDYVYSSTIVGQPQLAQGVLPKIMGIPIFVDATIQSGYILAATTHNMISATDIGSDESDVTITDMKKVMLGNFTRYGARFKIGQTYGIAAEITYRGIGGTATGGCLLPTQS